MMGTDAGRDAGTSDELGDLVLRWVRGWCVGRGRTHQERDGLLVVDVGDARRREELVVVDPAPATRDAALARAAGAEDVWVTFLPALPEGEPLPTGVHLELVGEALMSTVLSRPSSSGEAGSSPGDLVWEELAGGASYRVSVVVEGDEAAGGVVSVVGDTAVFDRIRTAEHARRRGHGSQVMDALTARALEQGATTGVLAASVEGQHLYRRLGWGHVCSMLTVRGGA